MARTLVGLDIGSSGLRAAELTVGRRTTLRRFATRPLPEGVVRAGAVVDPDALTEELKALWSEAKFGTKTVALGIANAGVLVRQMDLDWMPPADFRKALRYQVEDALPMPVDDANLDYHLLDELDLPGEGGETRRVARVLLVAAAREMVDAFVEATHRAGLRTVSVDIVPFALIRASGATAGATPVPNPGSAAGGTSGADGEDDAATAEAIVDIGADTVNVVVHSAGQPRYVRMVPGIGGSVITEALQQRYEWTREEAERTKIVVGLPGHSRLQPEEPRADGLDHPAQQVVAAEAESLVSEIVTTLNYVRGSAEESPALSRVLLTGAGSRLGGLCELLGRRLDIPVAPLAVQDQVRTPRRLRLSEDEECALAIPAGLCLGAGR
jgi:type IV pilus assembly protein PilM